MIHVPTRLTNTALESKAERAPSIDKRTRLVFTPEFKLSFIEQKMPASIAR